MKKTIKNIITKSSFLDRKVINMKNYLSTKNKLKNSAGQMKDKELEIMLTDLIINNDINNIVEIGTWNGLGSTKMLINVIKDSKKNIHFYSVESDKLCFKAAKKNLKKDIEYVNLILGRVHDIGELSYVNKNIIFDYGYDEKEYEWFIQDLRRYKKIKNVVTQIPNEIEILLLDGGEFSGFADFLNLHTRSKFIVLDDVGSFKQHNVLLFINENDKNFEIIYDSKNRNGVQIYRYLKNS
jgi:hypothetical protein